VPEARNRLAQMGLLAVDVVVALVLAGVGITELRSVGDDIFYRAADGFGVALVLAQTLPLALRRFYPVVVTAVICVAGSVMLWLDYPGTNALLAVPLALYSVAALRPRRTTVVVVVGALVLLVPPLAITQQNTLTFLVVAVVVFVVGAFAGDGVRARRLYAEALELRAEQAEHERELEAREAVIQERTRIARELHDAVGHTVNVMVMQAGAGRLASATDPTKSVEALTAIEDLGRATLGDIDRLLGLLREDGDDGATRTPTAGIRELPALVDRLASAGLDIDFAVEGDRTAVPGPVDAATYRIVQEALTNAVKHARGSRVTARVAIDAESLCIDVTDSGSPPSASSAAPRRSGGGRGLIGMQERVAALGGHLRTGPGPDGGFSVHAELPMIATAHDQSIRPDLEGEHR
jgi:signal transduction histidine kinase